MLDITVYAGPIFLVLIGVEFLVARRRALTIGENKDSATSIVMGVGNGALAVAYKFAILPLFYWIYQFKVFDIGHGAAAWIALFFAEDLCYYWFHRAHHRVRILWASHVTHHSSRHYNLATALRQSWTTSFTGFVFWCPLPLIGFDPLQIIVMQQISLLYQFWIHTETIGELGVLESVMNTPSHHRVHHATNDIYIDRNHAGVLIIWDKLFGTFQKQIAAEKPIYGLTKNINTYNPIRVAFHEWIACIAAASRATTWTNTLKTLFAPPNWQAEE